MKRILSCLLFIILATTGLAFNAKAASFVVKSKAVPNEMKKFDKFLDKHRNIENDLRANPNLINDAQYLSNHRDLENFLHHNPKITTDLSSNPNYFMNREERYQKHEKKTKTKRPWWHRW